MERLNGVGPQKLEKYAQAFLEVIKGFDQLKNCLRWSCDNQIKPISKPNIALTRTGKTNCK